MPSRVPLAQNYLVPDDSSAKVKNPDRVSKISVAAYFLNPGLLLISGSNILLVKQVAE